MCSVVVVLVLVVVCFVFFFKQKTAYEMRISDWSSDVCSSDLTAVVHGVVRRGQVDDRQSGGEKAVRAGAAQLPFGWRQCPPRPEQGPGLHRRRPGGEHPPGGRGDRKSVV